MKFAFLLLILYFLVFPFKCASRNDIAEINKFENFILGFCRSNNNKIIYDNSYFPFIFFVHGSYNMEFFEEQFSELPLYLKLKIYPITLYNEKEFLFLMGNVFIMDYHRINTFADKNYCPFVIEGNIIKKGERKIIQKNYDKF